MRYEKWIGDTSIQLEGEPEEIIQVLKYLDDRNEGIIIKDNEGNIVLYGDEGGSSTLKGCNTSTGWAPDCEDVELIIKLGEDELVRKVVNTINKKTKADNKGVCI